MEFIIITIISITFVIILKYLFKYNIKKIKEICKDEELDTLAKKYPDNIDICKEYLKKLNNNNVQIEENSNLKVSLYIALSNKILIGNINKSYTRIQTIAHECLHSVQDRKMLIFNFIYSNIYILYFITILILEIFQITKKEMLFLNILIILSFVYYTVRSYLENDAMINARYLAKEYMQEKQISTKEEINKIVEGFDKVNRVGIKCVNYNLFLNAFIKIIVFSIICIIR